MKPHKLLALCGVLLLLASSSACNKLKARDNLNKGVRAFSNSQYQQAVEHFKLAVQLDPQLLNARLYLATAYQQQYIPGGESPANRKIGEDAIAAFEDVLKQDTSNVDAVSRIGRLYFDMKNFDKAKEYQQRRIQLTPRDPEPYYWIGVINWAIAYPRAQDLRRQLNIMSPKDPMRPDVLPPIPDKERAQLEEQNKGLVTEGIQALEKTVELKPNDDAAMAYINLLYRQMAEFEPAGPERDANLKTADDWVDRALNAKKSAGAAATTVPSQ
jgi:tetratricopeptide (TPR) repeat protein